MEGVLALLLFSWFLFREWPRIMNDLEATPYSTKPDPLVARIRLARLKAGLPPEPEE